MSKLNGDRARFQKDRKRKLLRRQRVRAFVAGRRQRTTGHASLDAASLRMQDDSGPPRIGD